VGSAAGLGAGGLVGRTDGRDDLSAGPGGELYRVVADRTGAAGDEKRFALNRACGEHAAMGGHARDAQCGALCERDVIGQFGNEVDVEGDIFRRGAHPAAVALTVIQPDALAHPRVRDQFADLVDDARAVAVRDDPGILEGNRAPPTVGIGRVYP
jgi:hypothetical protein